LFDWFSDIDFHCFSRPGHWDPNILNGIFTAGFLCFHGSYIEEGLLEEKCSWTGKLQELTKHRETCPFQQVQCPHENCNTMMQRREIQEHERKCRYRIVACEVCLTELIQHELQHHQDSDCPDALIPCPNKCYSNRKITKIRRYNKLVQITVQYS
jgi:hypothetical protein